MTGLRTQALARNTHGPSRRTLRRETRKLYRGGMAGPVHRKGPLWYDPRLEDADDPAEQLMRPAVEFRTRLARCLRAMVLLVASAAMTPALPALLG